MNDASVFEPENIFTVVYGADSAELREWREMQDNPNTTLGELHNKYMNAVRTFLHGKVDLSLRTKAMIKFLQDNDLLTQEQIDAAAAPAA